MMVFTTISIPVISESNDNKIFGREHIRVIGRNFHFCEDDGDLYGHVFIGFVGIKIVYNVDIVIPNENIKFIIMSNHFLNCIYTV